jgi:hypothetical protein
MAHEAAIERTAILKRFFVDVSLRAVALQESGFTRAHIDAFQSTLLRALTDASPAGNHGFPEILRVVHNVGVINQCAASLSQDTAWEANANTVSIMVDAAELARVFLWKRPEHAIQLECFRAVDIIACAFERYRVYTPASCSAFHAAVGVWMAKLHPESLDNSHVDPTHLLLGIQTDIQQIVQCYLRVRPDVAPAENTETLQELSRIVSRVLDSPWLDLDFG